MATKRIKTAEATGPVLDWMVAKASNGRTPVFVGFNHTMTGPAVRLMGVDDESVFSPSTDWDHGGPIIDGMRGLKLKIGRKPGAPCYAHIVGYNGVERWHQTGKTPLIAAMRCFVASKLGDEVEVPEELT